LAVASELQKGFTDRALGFRSTKFILKSKSTSA